MYLKFIIFRLLSYTNSISIYFLEFSKSSLFNCINCMHLLHLILNEFYRIQASNIHYFDMLIWYVFFYIINYIILLVDFIPNIIGRKKNYMIYILFQICVLDFCKVCVICVFLQTPFGRQELEVLNLFKFM